MFFQIQLDSWKYLLRSRAITLPSWGVDVSVYKQIMDGPDGLNATQYPHLAVTRRPLYMLTCEGISKRASDHPHHRPTTVAPNP